MQHHGHAIVAKPLRYPLRRRSIVVLVTVFAPEQPLATRVGQSLVRGGRLLQIRSLGVRASVAVDIHRPRDASE